jgi:DNA-binding MarR family transcriptional regulator
MPSPKNSMQAAGHAESDAKITLGLLNAVYASDDLTQRSAARELGIALGLANAYLKRCVKKGLIKIRQVPRRRYAYYLTPHGFAEKSRLTAEYLSTSLSYFRRARTQFSEIFDYAAQRGWRRIGLLGAGELAEIATLSAHEYGIELTALLAPDLKESHTLGLPVVAAFADIPESDALLITDIHNAQSYFDRACALYPADRILVPKLLGVVRQL